MRKIKMPWIRRAEETEEALKDDELRLKTVQDDWDHILLYKSNIDKEIRLNDWTSTVSRIFAGKHAQTRAHTSPHVGELD